MVLSLGRLRATFVCRVGVLLACVLAQDFPLPGGKDRPIHKVPLLEQRIGNFQIFQGRETAETAQPFFMMPGQMGLSTVADALHGVEGLYFDDHNDEADWRPAFEVYIMEGGQPLPVASPPLVVAMDELVQIAMPFVQHAYQCPTCVPCTCFVRRYLPSERLRIPAHFDITAYATIILPLSPAINYTGGFFVQPDPHIDSRMFVPVEVGDVILHDFTLNHGVEVLDGGRFSLVIWVSQSPQACKGSSTPWHSDRALNGDAVAQHILGMMFSQGNGAPKDDVQAFHWTRLAAEGGLVNAQFSLGTMYVEGHGTVANNSNALQWYERAATRGDASAQMICARMYGDGIGVDVDNERARYWYALGSSQRGAALMGPPSWA
eukprot:TRINITY_DN61919_c0_g1_i1.p1 TRINITY_DN61919_c0_g1~~TRINITY_DN61919_c0_g1_i1.p1  ORF type:complete len:377 (-),score=43.18 TRINITY_DN61919_c0_g1_i1:97-1227(-)